MSTHKYLDNTGLGQVWEKIKNLTSRKTSSIPFGQVDNTSTATVFTATIDGVDELRDGVCVYLKNGVISSASGWTLNINNLGAKPVYQTQAAASRTTTVFNVAYTGLFVYNSSRVDGGCWDYFYGYNSDTNTTAYQVRANQTINEMHAALTRYKICFTMFDGTLLPSTSVSNSTATTKALTTEAFDPYGAIFYYSTTTGVAAGESPGASYMWLLYPTVDMRYTFNTGTTLVAKDNVYIKCSPQADGSVKLAGNDCIVQILPSTDDGYVYIYLGKAYDTYRMSLDINHPIYYYKGGAIRLWSNVEATDLSNYLAKDNSTSYTPTGNYNPATKKYVDDSKSLMTVVIQAHAENGVTTYFANKTYEELFSHIENNDGDAICLYMTNVYRLLSCNNGVISFHNVCVFDDEGDGIVEGQFITIDYNDVVTLSNRFEYFIANPSTVTPSPAGVASIGSNYTFALADHVHPTDTTRAAVNDVLTKTNAISYTPTSDYHPATKKYVDDAIGSTSCATISEIEEMCDALGFQSVTIDTSDYVDDDN